MRWNRVSWVLGGRHNPLRRRVDKIEAAILVALAVVFVVGAPVLAVSAISWSHAAGLRQLRTDAAYRQVPATLLEAAGAGQPVPDGGQNVALVPARWTAPSGRTRIGVLETPPGLPAGARVTVWVTGNGQLTSPPPSSAAVTEQMVLAAIGAVVGLAVLLWLIAVAVRLAANKRRIADWAAGWAAMSPRGRSSAS